MVSLDGLKKVDQVDCKSLLVEKKVLNQMEWESMQEVSKDKILTEEYLKFLKSFCYKNVKSFKPEVIEWLEKNIDPVKDKKQPQGWCVGSEEYQVRSEFQTSVWFARKKDALKFIEQFSVHKKPTTYFDYFKGIRKELDMKKRVLVTVDDYSEEVRRSIYK